MISLFSLVVQENVIILYGNIDSSDNEYLDLKLKKHCQRDTSIYKNQRCTYKYLNGMPAESSESSSENTLKRRSDICIVVSYKNVKDRMDEDNIIKKMLPRMAKQVLNIVQIIHCAIFIFEIRYYNQSQR